MNKKVIAISLGAITIITVIAGTVWYFQNSKQTVKGKCGDGVCDNLEKANANLCSQDCKTKTETTTSPISTSAGQSSANISPDSPFGVHPAEGGNGYAYARDLGIRWDREGMYFVWNWIDAGKNGKLNFTQAVLPATPNGTGGGAFNYDQERIKLNAGDIEMMVNICPFRRGGEFGSDAEKTTYQNFVEKTVERYDGDGDLGCTLNSPDCYNKGDGQYPSNDLISKFKTNPIKYWQLCNSVNDTCGSREGCLNGNYATKYAEALKLTYEAVKKSDSSASVLIAGDSEKDLYPAVYKALNGKYIDIIDLHRFSMQSPEGSAWYNPKNDFDYLKAALQSSGFDVNKLRFWITEAGTYSGYPSARVGKAENPYQDEKKQANDLLKVYVSALSYNIEKVFWAWSIVEGFQRDCGFFDYTGLVYDGCDCSNGKYTCGSNLGYDLGKGVKKLSYYTYKKITETLDGSDWKNIQTIQEKDGIYIYKFTKNGKPIWVAWNDNADSKTVNLNVGNIASIKVIEAVPKYASGKEVTDYNSAFNTESKTVQGGLMSLTLKDVPLFIKE